MFLYLLLSKIISTPSLWEIMVSPGESAYLEKFCVSNNILFYRLLIYRNYKNTSEKKVLL